MGLRKEILLTVKDYTIKLDKEIKFYENDTIDLCFSILEYGIEVKDEVVVNKLMPINTLSAYMCIETPQGVDYAEATEIEGNRVIFKLGSKYSQFIGVGRMQIVIRDSDGCRITLPEFPFEIRKSIYDNKGDEGLEYLSTELNEAIVDEYGNPIKMVKISELEEATTLPTNSYTMIIDGSSNKKIKTDLLSSGDNYDDTEIRLAIDNKVDKIDGHSLVADAEIARLASVNNYDDTEIKEYTKQYVDDEIINRLGDLELVTLTQEEYDGLEVKEDNVLYFIETDGDVESSKYVKEDEYTAFKNSANSRLDKVESDIISVNSQLEEVFQSVSNGKLLIAEAITDKGVETSATDTFQTMATNINNIQSGSGGDEEIKMESRTLVGKSIKYTHTLKTKMRNTNITSTEPVGLLKANGKYSLKYRVENGIVAPDNRYKCDEYDFEIPYPLCGDGIVKNEIRQKENGGFEFVRRCSIDSVGNSANSLSLPPTPVRNKVCCAYDGVDKLYLIGGKDISAEYTLKTQVYSFSTGIWSYLADTPEKFHENNAQIYNNKIYVFGGYFYNSDSRPKLYIYDIETDTWGEGATAPSYGEFATSVIHDDNIYVIGFSSYYTNYLYKYNITSNTWSTLKNSPVSFGYSPCCVVGDKIHVFAGNSKAYAIYDIKTDTWENKTSEVPWNFYNGRCVVVGDIIYLINAAGTDYFYSLDTKTGEFTDLGGCVIQAQGRYSFVRDNYIYTFGGYGYQVNDKDTYPYTQAEILPFYKYSLDKGEWDVIPPFYIDCGTPSATQINDKIYIYESSYYYLWEYDIPTKKYKRLTRVPNGQSYIKIVAYGNYIYVANRDSTYGKILQIYDTVENKWLDGIAMPFTYAYIDMVIWDGILYIFGYSSSSSQKNIMLAYNIQDASFRQLEQPYGQIRYTEAVAVDGKIYWFGGRDGDYNYYKNTRIYDIATDTWNLGENMPTELAEYCSVAHNGKIYIIGGADSTNFGSSNNFSGFKSVYVYDIVSDSWSRGADIPSSSISGCCCVYNNRIYLFCGSHKGTNTSYSYLTYILDIAKITTFEEEIIPLTQDFNMTTQKHVTEIIPLHNPQPTITVDLDVEIP